MIVAFNARQLYTPLFRGLTVYTLNLLARLPKFGVRPVLCSPEGVHAAALERLPAGSYELATGGPRSPIVWDQVWPRLVPQAQVIHATGNYGLPLCTRRPTVATVHDAIDFCFYWDRIHDGFFSTSYLKARWMHASTRWAADRVITVSEFSRKQIHQRLRVPWRKLVVTLESADESFRPASETAISDVRERYQLQHPFFFYLGGWEGRKNVPFLLRSFAESGAAAELVLAGGTGPETIAMQKWAKVQGYDRAVRWIGRVPDADLAPLYSAALAFVYPSRMEGFGLQLCEAMACGCPVLAAKAGSMPEILGDGGNTFPLNDTTILARQLRRFTDDPTHRAKQSSRALARSQDFSWDRCAEQTVNVYRQLL